MLDAHRNHARPDPADIHAAVWPVGCCADVLPGGDIHEQQDEKSSRSVILATWDDVPHLDERAKEMLFASYMPFQRDARTKGIPALGSGAIYPVPESDIVIPDFALPNHWPRAYGMDVGWNRTAAIWGAFDRETSTSYLYSQHYRGEAEPVVHAEAVKSRGKMDSWRH